MLYYELFLSSKNLGNAMQNNVIEYSVITQVLLNGTKRNSSVGYL